MENFKNDICESCQGESFDSCSANFEQITLDAVTRNVVDSDLYKAKEKHLLKITYECDGKTAVEEKYVYELPDVEWKDKQQAKGSYEDEFEFLWNMYPRKEGKTRAYKAYVKARRGGTAYEDIESGIIAYIAQIKAEKIERAYVKHGGTWFYNECWNDEYNTEPVRAKGQLQSKPSYDLEKIKRDAMNNTDI